MSAVQIDKDVPMPNRPQGKGPLGRIGDSKWPWAKLEVGDSFVMPGVKHPNAAACANSYGKYHGIRFRTAKVEGGIRIWRVA